MGWQPIETLKPAFEACGHYCMDVIVTDGDDVVPGQAYDNGIWDLTAWTYDGNDEVSFVPTHWMPLPDPPA